SGRHYARIGLPFTAPARILLYSSLPAGRSARHWHKWEESHELITSRSGRCGGAHSGGSGVCRAGAGQYRGWGSGEEGRRGVEGRLAETGQGNTRGDRSATAEL